MGDLRAIAAAVDGVVRLLDRATADPVLATAGVSPEVAAVTTDAFADLVGTLDRTTRVTVHLFRVAASAQRAPEPTVPRRDGAARVLAPTVVDCHMLVTAWSADAAAQQVALAWAVRVLEENRTLPAAFLNGGAWADTFAAEESVDLWPYALTLQDEKDLWQFAPALQRPSVSLVARAVRIDSTVTVDLGAPVRVRALRFAPHVPEPV